MPPEADKLQRALDFDLFVQWANALPEDWHTPGNQWWCESCPIAQWFNEHGFEKAEVGFYTVRLKGMGVVQLPDMMMRVRRQTDERAARAQTFRLFKIDLLSAIAEAKIEVGMFNEPGSARKPRGEYDKTRHHK